MDTYLSPSRLELQPHLLLVVFRASQRRFPCVVVRQRRGQAVLRGQTLGLGGRHACAHLDGRLLPARLRHLGNKRPQQEGVVRG